MPVLTVEELRDIRNECSRTLTVNYNKGQVALAAQAIEDFLDANAGAVSSAINTATSPFVFTAAQKKKIFAEVVRKKYERDK